MRVPYHTTNSNSSLSQLAVIEPRVCVKRSVHTTPAAAINRRCMLMAAGGVAATGLIVGPPKPTHAAAPLVFPLAAKVATVAATTAWSALKWLGTTLFADYLGRKAEPLIDMTIDEIRDLLFTHSGTREITRKPFPGSRFPRLHLKTIHDSNFSKISEAKGIPLEQPMRFQPDYGMVTGLKDASMLPLPMFTAYGTQYSYNSQRLIEDENQLSNDFLAQASRSLRDGEFTERFPGMQVHPFRRPPANNPSIRRQFELASRLHTPEGVQPYSYDEIEVYGTNKLYSGVEEKLFKVTRGENGVWLSDRFNRLNVK